MVQVVGQLVKQINTKKKELTEFQEKYKIRIKVAAPSWHSMLWHMCAAFRALWRVEHLLNDRGGCRRTV